LAYQTAYLKANYPWHFAASLLTIEAQNSDKLALYLGDCRERGIPVLPPDLNASQVRFTVAPEGVRFGLTAIKNVGEGAVQALLAVRTARGRIASLHALCEELDLRLFNRRVFESLIKAGALDSIGRADPALATLPARALRPRLLAAVDAATEHGLRLQRDRQEGQAQLFASFTDDEDAPGPVASPGLPEAAAWAESEQLQFEKETLGLYWSGHPVEAHAADLRELGARTTADLADITPTPRTEAWGLSGPKPIEPDISLGGIVATLRPLKTRKGDRMAVFTLEDAHGSVEVIAFPEAFHRAAHLLEVGTLVLVRGKLERDDESTRILAAEVTPLATVRERVAREVAIRLSGSTGRSVYEALGEIFARHRGDRRVAFELEVPAAPRRLLVRADVSAQIRVRPSATLVAELEHLVGPGAVSLR
jgi:DNA polymerase-3 subunit alpha